MTEVMKRTADGNGGPKKKKARVQSKPLPIAAGSNWSKLKSQLKPSKQTTEKPKKQDLHYIKEKKSNEKKPRKTQTIDWIDTSKIVAMDCEMVGVGVGGTRSVLARCSIVDYDGNVLYDEHVKPLEKVTDFRTHVSGIRSKSLRNAIPFPHCQKDVGEILKDKILVGHALRNDIQALMMTHPKTMIRDTTKYRPYMRRKANGTKLYPKALRHLAQEVLDKTIQTGEHDSVEDARTTLELYKKVMIPWEKALKASPVPGGLVGQAPINVKAKEKAQRLAAGIEDEDDDDFVSAVKNMEANREQKANKNLRVPDAQALMLQEYDE